MFNKSYGLPDSKINSVRKPKKQIKDKNDAIPYICQKIQSQLLTGLERQQHEIHTPIAIEVIFSNNCQLSINQSGIFKVA